MKIESFGNDHKGLFFEAPQKSVLGDFTRNIFFNRFNFDHASPRPRLRQAVQSTREPDVHIRHLNFDPDVISLEVVGADGWLNLEVPFGGYDLVTWVRSRAGQGYEIPHFRTTLYPHISPEQLGKIYNLLIVMYERENRKEREALQAAMQRHMPVLDFIQGAGMLVREGNEPFFTYSPEGAMLRYKYEIGPLDDSTQWEAQVIPGFNSQRFEIVTFAGRLAIPERFKYNPSSILYKIIAGVSVPNLPFVELEARLAEACREVMSRPDDEDILRNVINPYVRIVAHG